jgi:hypothetical protein
MVKYSLAILMVAMSVACGPKREYKVPVEVTPINNLQSYKKLNEKTQKEKYQMEVAKKLIVFGEAIIKQGNCSSSDNSIMKVVDTPTKICKGLLEKGLVNIVKATYQSNTLKVEAHAKYNNQLKTFNTPKGLITGVANIRTFDLVQLRPPKHLWQRLETKLQVYEGEPGFEKPTKLYENYACFQVTGPRKRTIIPPDGNGGCIVPGM